MVVTNLEGSVLISCTDTLSLGLLQVSDKLNKKLPSGVKLITSKVDRYEVHTINKKTDSKPSLDNLSQPTSSTQIVHTKHDLMRWFPDCFQSLGKFQGEPYLIEVDPSVPSKMTPCRPVPLHEQAHFKQQLAEMQVASIIKPVNHATPWINSFIIVN